MRAGARALTSSCWVPGGTRPAGGGWVACRRPESSHPCVRTVVKRKKKKHLEKNTEKSTPIVIVVTIDDVRTARPPIGSDDLPPVDRRDRPTDRSIDTRDARRARGWHARELYFFRTSSVSYVSRCTTILIHYMVWYT
jgi:hypothetical protein